MRRCIDVIIEFILILHSILIFASSDYCFLLDKISYHSSKEELHPTGLRPKSAGDKLSHDDRARLGSLINFPFGQANNRAIVADPRKERVIKS